VSRSVLMLLSGVLWVGGCTLPEGRTEESEAERRAYCTDLNRQITEMAKRPVRRGELQRRYEEECLR